MAQSPPPTSHRLGGRCLITADNLADTKKTMVENRIKMAESKSRMIDPTTRQFVVSAEWSACALDKQGCLSLEQILKSFSAPISEEHAWAIIHQSLVCLSRLLENLVSNPLLHLVTSTSDILLSSDGSVDEKTYSLPGNGRKRAVRENKIVAELGVVIFNGLDYGLKLDEERQLSPALENIIDLMTSADEGLDDTFDTDDEGIERDEDDAKDKSAAFTDKSGTSLTLINLCRNHLALPTESESHFKAVCRALVSEALELSFFMEKVSRSKRDTAVDSELGELELQDWARLWVQVIHELRSGLKLKKTEYTKTPIEYELTPYEILMDDIRSRRYKLNKVFVDGRLPPTLKKDAHDVILDFIRSRPPLKPAGERKLQLKPRKQSTPVELLMESIRSDQSRTRLRKTAGPTLRPIECTRLESSRCNFQDWEPSPLSNRRVIQPDQDLMDSLLNFSEDEDEEDDDDESDDGNEEREKKKNWHTKLALDLILHGPSLLNQERRHSVSVCETPTRSTTSTRKLGPGKQFSLDLRKKDRKPGVRKQRIQVDLELNSPHSVLSSSSTSLDSNVDPGNDEEEENEENAEKISIDENPVYNINTDTMHAKLHSEFIKSEHWVSALQTIELSLEEVVHIRSVLSRAELEAIPLDNNLKEDVVKGKLCFLCMRTRFSLLVWGVRCQLCSQQVCSRCSNKMRIPLEHFSSVPAFALSPHTPVLSPEPQQDGVSSSTPDIPFFPGGGSAGSAPTSPNPRRRSQEASREGARSSFAGPISLPMFTSQGPTKISARFGELKRVLSREDTRSRRESIEGTLLTVCTDCKEMVLQVVRSQKTAQRLQMAKSLYLQLSPGYKQEIY
ncbi:protein spire homolog 1 isoform X2 [Eurytemora carolleeae]|uniref:protein spire homolog 1 isoform X2 n=1 Tax=Eurytemora carolleeae TaxID=1294199 RepID=UPI000C76FDE1|nr:protein spire homolog 1 isoform X2 [Eurytemora carolleeae]|eukprot:XP_023323232.1 protein spire homolog 1-like isoform X2 [Eurytemora affinis]